MTEGYTRQRSRPKNEFYIAWIRVEQGDLGIGPEDVRAHRKEHLCSCLTFGGIDEMVRGYRADGKVRDEQILIYLADCKPGQFELMVRGIGISLGDGTRLNISDMDDAERGALLTSLRNEGRKYDLSKVTSSAGGITRK